MFETTEMMIVPLMSREFETDAAELKIEVRYWTDDGLELQAEPLTYHMTGDTLPTKVGNCTMSMFVRRLVRAELDDYAMRIIRDSNPAFESMSYAEPPISRDEFQRMVL